jgi:2-polyprenyl-3-methyl-5-hydroxy-6-metoxy-1,4-benzoquinol methylase
MDWTRFSALVSKFQGGKFLEVGCFNSPLPIYVKDEWKGSEVWAVDHAPNVIADLKAKFPDINYLCADINVLPFEPESFDYIVAGELIEHLEHPKTFVEKMFALLKPGGTLALSTPFEELMSQPMVSDEHLWAFTVQDVEDLLNQGGVVSTTVYRDTVPFIVGHGTKK